MHLPIERLAAELSGAHGRCGTAPGSPKGRTISAAVAQAAVLSLRNLLDDITAWGWADAPPCRLVLKQKLPSSAAV